MTDKTDGVDEIMIIVRHVIKEEIKAGHLMPGPVKMED